MAPYSIPNAALDFIGFANTTIVIVWLISVVQPLFERVRDSCRAGQPPAPGERTIVLLTVFYLIPATWAAAAALYYRHLSLLWECMGIWLAQEPVNRLVYALLHLYLFFLLVCGLFAWAVTCFEICRNFRVSKDIFMIARFSTRRDHAIQDMEAQRESLVDTEAETPSTGGNVRNTSSATQNEDSHRNGQEANGDVAAMSHVNDLENATEEHDSPGINPFVDGSVTRTVHYSTQYVGPKISAWHC